MKPKSILVKVPFILSLFIVFMLSSGSCTKDISGECYLHIMNKVDQKIKIYFDGDKIGKIDANSGETWNVPVGQHLLKATSRGLESWEEYHSFDRVERIEIFMEEDKKAGTNIIVIRAQMQNQDF